MKFQRHTLQLLPDRHRRSYAGAAVSALPQQNRYPTQLVSSAAAKKGRLIYNEAVLEALIVVWEAADRICGKRLKAALPHLVEYMECHGHLYLDARVRKQLLSASAATLDRLLQPIRTPAGRRLRRRRNQSPGRNIPVRTFADWNTPPGFLEIDLMVHHGGSLWGSMIHSLVATDICTVSRTALSSLKLSPACLSLDFRLHWRLIGQCER